MSSFVKICNEDQKRLHEATEGLQDEKHQGGVGAACEGWVGAAKLVGSVTWGPLEIWEE